MKKKFIVKGMSCASCVAHVEKACMGVEGVKSCNVSLLTNSMEVEFESNEDIKRINKAVSDAGYKSYLDKEKGSTKEENTDILNELIRLILSIILLIPLFYLSMGMMLDWNIGYFKEHHMVLGILLMIISFSMMLLNKKFYINAFKALKHKTSNMDTLVSLGSSVAFIYSTVILIIMAHYSDNMNMSMVMKYSMNISFETAGMVPTLISVGKFLETLSKGKTTSALNALIDMSPKSAHVKNGDKIEDVLVSDVKIGDIFLVKPGESIPVDGIVVEGEASVSEALLTGESMPVFKEAGSKIYQATINVEGMVYCKAVGVGEDTSFSKIIKMVEEASSSKAPIARIADKVASYFVPIVISISVIVFIFWMIFGSNFVKTKLEDEMLIIYALERAISVLVISCPCALGLATPVAIMVGSGKGYKNQILFKNAEILEKSSNVDFVVLDKTGTITKGMPKISEVYSFGISKEELLKLASSVESLSEHPLAKAICDSYDGSLYSVSSFKNMTGRGVYGMISFKEIYAINPKYAKTIVTLDKEEEDLIKKESSLGKTIICIIYDNKLCGIISIVDEIKEDSFKAISDLKKLGITPIMLTGDNKEAAFETAKTTGIEYVVSGVLPEGKLDIINKLKEKGKVMMVGDGINDAPSLTAADVGVAIGAGADVAIDAADIVLLRSSVYDVVKAIRLARKTMVNIKENLFWAFFYNVIMIPVAAGAFSGLGLYKMKPWYGALIMALSSIFVIFNALRLNIVNLDKISGAKKAKNIDLKILNGDNNMKELTIKVKGMMCSHCEAHVKEACMKVSGVEDAKASKDNKEVIIYYNEEVNIDLIKQNIKEAGYEVE